ncbi:substrate-binding domain-containing protein [Desulfoluna spongiiphila]|uniref:Transcriptional regulator of molybdate metabolism, XRE family n=1 Tax=Desulfoluna spongiiphila TaxID=419481 RepID=A0A1G5JL47_9BACT|nr:substrate-binding domain-containing protein [Desulfoluna spongiiphila]SCY88438.1 transcriptional regulator of molybdate metabolism, XRE family [Desulfoluna spongiiphila]
MAPLKIDIVCNLKTYRLGKGWTQDELAEKAGLRRQAIYDIESGRYLPNTAVALKLARLIGCRVEDLFVDQAPPETRRLDAIHGEAEPATRLALGRVRHRLVGLPMDGPASTAFGFCAADGLMARGTRSAEMLTSDEALGKTLILMGCDPAFGILGTHLSRKMPDARIHCRFASSTTALEGLHRGVTHLAGTHMHNTGEQEANLVMVDEKMKNTPCRVVGFSLMEEGLMVARGNPLGIRRASDLARPGVRFVNREPGAALRVLLDDHLERDGVPEGAVSGYRTEVTSHGEGAVRVICDVADAALGLKGVAEAWNLDFVSMAVARCDLVIPGDLEAHAGIRALLDLLQSPALRREIDSLPGYDSAVTGKMIA